MTRAAPSPIRPLPRSFLARDATVAAPELLNKLLVANGCVGRIVEVEAYTADDPASHSARGRTPRNTSMFARPGTLYVYFTYGIHHCANVVTGRAGEGQAVLLRAVEVVDGIELVRERRGGRPDRELANGPGKLCQAFALDRAHDGIDLCARAGPVRLGDDGTPPPDRPVVGPRIGISVATERPWRWRIAGSVPADPGAVRV